MLIDIEKYIRQMLPPDRRLPKHVGLGTLLFSPVNSVINAFNDFAYNSQFDTGTAGQVGVLEFILQNVVNNNIRVLNADGVKVDFRVLVPESLSASARAEVVRIVERHRLRSKRYEVTDLLDWGSGGGPPKNLAWLIAPRVVPYEDRSLIEWSVNKVEVVFMRIINTTTGEVVQQNPQFETFVGLVGFSFSEPGIYRVELGSLRGTVTIAGAIEIGIKPNWLTKIVFNYDPNAHECSKYVNATADIEMLIVEASGVAAGGITWGGGPWNQTTWIPGTNLYSDGYNEVFRANGASFGKGGILPGSTYKIKVRRTAVPDEVFVYTWTAPVTIVTKQEVVFGPVVGTCRKGPFIGQNSISAEPIRLIFSIDAEDVRAFQWRIKKGGLVAREGVQPMVNENGSAKFNPSYRPVLNFSALEPGPYVLEIEGSSCSSGVSSQAFIIEEGETEEPEEPTPGNPSQTLLGTYEVTVNGVLMTWQKALDEDFQIGLNANREITDVTPGTVHGTNGNPTTRGGRTIFYKLGYRDLADNLDSNSPVYRSLKDIPMKLGAIHTISCFSCDANNIPNLEAFMAGASGWPISTGVNKYNTVLSQITLTLHDLSSSEGSLWLRISRKLRFPYFVKNRASKKKVFAIESINNGEDIANYHAKGVWTQSKLVNGLSQPFTCRTWKWPWDWKPGMPLFTDNDLYNFLRNIINAFGLTADTVITDEVPENAQGGDPNIGNRMYLTYKGALELLQEKFPGLTKRLSNLFGPYGADKFYGMHDPAFMYKHDKQTVAQYLSSKVHYTWDVNNGVWGGIAGFFASMQHKVRNVNIDYYMYFGAQKYYNIALELIFANERIKIGTKTFQGEDHECDWMVFGTPLTQTLMKDDTGEMGPEITRTGDVMPSNDGEFLSKYNTPPAGNAEEFYDLAFWSCLLGRGLMLWDGGGTYGSDPSKINTWLEANQYYAWFPGGQGGNREPYIPGHNGAPTVDMITGMKDTLFASCVDNAMAGYQAAMDLEGYADTLYYASYNSNRKTFVAQPGQAGYHLNGFGPLNIGMLAMKDAEMQKAGVGLFGQGPKGKCAIFTNGFLSRHEFETNVNVTYGTDSVTFPKVWGGETVYVKF